MSNQSQTI